MAAVERGVVPDALVRLGIRRLLEQRLAEIGDREPDAAAEAAERFVAAMREAPIAPLPQLANAQHYELPPEFFARVLGPHMKYSCCHWPPGATDLETAERSALESTCERAGIGEGQDILELGCGWGSLSLWMARRHPSSRVTAVSNSRPQREFILARARQAGLANLVVLTADMNDFDPRARFDRIVSVEMFEHMRNWPRLFARVRDWLRHDGRFFMHVFCHRGAPYEFVDAGPQDWMSRHFFAGGMMPGDDLPLRLQDDLQIDARWRWSGRHYQRTARAWLERMDVQRPALEPVLRAAYGDAAPIWRMRWRLFFMACEELFGWEGGRRWWVGHYRFKPRSAR
ncbi:MAG: cyclopropane-fatty-acyl-phospholipid synthase family protein [Gammaproteobacteria bacterium]